MRPRTEPKRLDMDVMFTGSTRPGTEHRRPGTKYGLPVSGFRRFELEMDTFEQWFQDQE